MKKMIYLVDDMESTIKRILSDEELSGLGLNKTKIRHTLSSFQGDEIATSVFFKKYALKDENKQILELTLDESKDRWASEIVKPEKKLSLFDNDIKDIPYFRELYEYFLPGGRQMYALGNPFVKKASYTNCYVTDIEEDSIEGIFDTAKRIAKTYSYGGGIGFCLGKLRQKKAKVSNTARYSTGSVSFMELYSLITKLIGEEGRRAALMLTMPINHPDIEDFIEIKHKDNNNVRFANISVKISNAFMNAVINDNDFELLFETQHEIFKKNIKARELWQKLIQSARDSAEPGLLFWDHITEDSPTDTYEQLKVICTNPCSELPLAKGGTCTLGSMLLHKFVKNPFTENAEFDFLTFKKMVSRAVRHLDNVTELNFGRHPLAEQEQGAQLGRRIGLGITGLADMLAALGLKYDSQEAIDLTSHIMNVKMIEEYKASINLAKTRGAFPVFDKQCHYERGFCARLPEDIKELGRTYGQRNAGISTVAPNGSLSIIAQCSSGMEPIFSLEYTRNVELGKDRKQFKIVHQGISRFKFETGSETIPSYWVTAHNIDYNSRIKIQAAIQRYTDASISSTINLHSQATVEDVGEIYMAAWKAGLKGITVYREGSREGVLLTNDFSKLSDTSNMDTVIYEALAEGGDKFYIPISYQDRDIRKPHQVFLINYKTAENDRFVKISNDLIRMLRERSVDEKRIQKYIDRSITTLSKLTRFLSLAMKTGYFKEAVDILEKHATVGTLAAELHKILNCSLNIKNAICRKCGSSNVRMEESCMYCLDCNWSGCS